MIHLDRELVVEPPVLSRVYDSDGKSETERAKDHYKVPGWDGKTGFDYTRYSHDDVKAALYELNHEKCAYCESRLKFVSHLDIEHWRPKKSVILGDGSERKPGYYWLGATWDNLLPSCQQCNRRSRHEDARDPNIEQTGKQSLFPVADEQKRWLNPHKNNEEEPLLLNPCEDDPSDYLSIDQDAVIHEMRADEPWNRRARESIEVYGLNRVELVAERREHHRRVVALLEDVKREIEYCDETQDEGRRARHRQVITDKLADLKRERDDASPYLFMKQPLIDECLRDIGPGLVRIGLAG